MTRTEPEALYQGVERAAARLISSWRVLIVVTSLYVVASAAVTVLALFLPDATKAYAVGFAVITAIMVYNVSRFVPRAARAATPTIALSAHDKDRMATWIAAGTDGWRPEVRLSAGTAVRVENGALVVGMPLWTCLRQPELAVLVRDARRRADSVSHGRLGRAQRIVDGGLAKRFRQRDGRDARLTRHLVARVDARTADLEEAHARWTDSVRQQIEPNWETSHETVLIVREAWEVITRRWLDPALTQGVWHDDPFAAVRGFIEGCEHIGMIRRAQPRLLGRSSTELLESNTVYSVALAEVQAAGAPHEKEPTAWAGHPSSVTVPMWRSFLAIGLQAADRATGAPQQATVDNLLVLLENGWGQAIAATVMAESGDVQAGASPMPVMQNILAAAVSLALLDSGAVRATWRLPYGTLLESRHGHVVPVDALVLEALASLDAGGTCVELRDWLYERGVNLSEPTWLAGGVQPARERAVFSFEAFRGLRTFHVVLTNQSLRLFRRGPAQAVREGIRMEISGPSTVLSPRVQAVNQGDFTDQSTALDLASIVHATFSPLMGGHWWRLRVRSPQQVLTLRGSGDGREIASMLESSLGDRLAARWLHGHGWLRISRNLLGFVCGSLGCLGLIVGVVFLLSPATDLPRLSALVIAAISVAIIAIGHLPDLIAAIIDRLRRPIPKHFRASISASDRGPGDTSPHTIE